MTGGRLPKIICCNIFDATVCYKALVILEKLYQRQPFSGYHQDFGRDCDDDEDVVQHGVGGRIHRFSVRMDNIAKTLLEEKLIINDSAIMALSLFKPLLETSRPWRPYLSRVARERPCLRSFDMHS